MKLRINKDFVRLLSSFSNNLRPRVSSEFSRFIKSNKRNDGSGFTLIELLVVISVIAILSTLLMANFVGIRQRGRDGQRKSDLNNIRTALELYRADSGAYPLTDGFPECGAQLSNNGTVYIEEVPCDPLVEDEEYVYTSDGRTYTIVACLENENDSEADETTQDQCNTASFTLTNP